MAMGRIHILDDQVANQIAAGEVVERPSSVVKELVENAIDAGSTRIDVEIGDGGLQYIRVTDNGSGIQPDDCEMAFQRHATSKIRDGKDLFRIRSLGFRGEALPSIAAVSRVECLTSADNSGLGRRLVVEGGKLVRNEEAAAPRGTDIQVRDLFYNTPARLKYMKTIQTELGHVSDYIYRLAFSRPDIAFTLKHNDHVLLRTQGTGDLLAVIAAVYGTATARKMIRVSSDSLDYRITGYVSRPELTRANRNGMTMIVNGRYIRNFTLANALMQAYHTLLPVHRYPLAVLHITMDPELIDVNVHPAKLEVRFSKEPELVRFVSDAVKQALDRETLIPQGPSSAGMRRKPEHIQEQLELYGQSAPYSSAGGRTQTAEAREAPPAPEVSSAFGGSSFRERLLRESSFGGSYAGSSGSRAAGNVHRGGAAGSGSMPVPVSAPGSMPGNTAGREQARGPSPDPDSIHAFLNGLKAPEDSPDAAEPVSDPMDRVPGVERPDETGRREDMQPADGTGAARMPKLYPIGQMHGTYIIAQNENGLYLIDQHAAHERLNYEYYLEKFGRPEEASQELLVPIVLEFTPSDALLLKDRLGYLQQVGVYMEPFGGNTFKVTAYPHWLPPGEEKSVIEEMAEWVLKERKAPDVAKLREQSAMLCSCKASIKANQPLGMAEMEELLERLRHARNPFTCPHGRPIVVSFSNYELEKMFKRVM